MQKTVTEPTAWALLLILFATDGLLAIWPLPNTIAVRHLLLIAGAIGALFVIKHYARVLVERSNWHLWIFLSFFLWLVFHYFFLATNVEEQLYDLKGDWARTVLATLTGLAAGLFASSDRADKWSALFKGTFLLALSGTVSIYLARYLIEVIHTGQLLHTDFFLAPYLGKTPLVVFGSIFLCGIFARQSVGLSNQRPPVSYTWTVLSSTAVGLTFFLANTKNGIIVLIAVVLTFAVRIARSRLTFNLTEKLTFAVALLALGSIVAIHIHSNSAWQNFYADVKAGHDIEKNQNWKNAEKYPLPTNERGQVANASTYERSAWATAGVILVKEHPLGYGLINHSFGALALERWPDFYKPIGKYRHASHSGLLDFTLGFGIPGLVMVLLPMWVCYFRAIRTSGFWYEFVRWSVPIVTLVYTVTEVCTGHFIEFLFFYIALICGITIRKRKT